jgi:hypothetical protein
MARLTADSDNDSDYGYDLTAEEEELVAHLVATASAHLQSSQVDPKQGDARVAVRDGAADERSYEGRLLVDEPDLASLEGKLSPAIDDQDVELAAFVTEAKPSLSPSPLENSDIRYPDCEEPFSIDMFFPHMVLTDLEASSESCFGRFA